MSPDRDGWICPDCCGTGTLTSSATIELTPDDLWDEICLNLVACSACEFRGAILGLKSPGHGDLGEDTGDMTSYRLGPASWEAICAVIYSCPSPNRRMCKCQAHQELSVGGVRAATTGSFQVLQDPADSRLPRSHETTLSFCTRCGKAVSPYPPSTTSLSDAREYGVSPEGICTDSHYWCSFCAEHWLATNMMDTGKVCPACKTFMPLVTRYCGGCGDEFEERPGSGSHGSTV